MAAYPLLVAFSLWLAEVVAPGTPPGPHVAAAAAAIPGESEIRSLVASQYAAWDARNIDAFLGTYWRSANLVYVVEGAVTIGWDDVRGRLTRQYPTREAMGHPILESLEVHPVSMENAGTVEWWTVVFPQARVRGNTANAWHHFPEGWRIVQTCTSVTSDP